MKKFAVFSGFLGSGKTTTMMALTRFFSARHGKAAMISNDLGQQSLADHKLAALSGCNASELTGSCICYITKTLVERLDSLFDKEGCELVISDIPGFGVGALDHVYHTLHRDYPGRYELAPFTVLTEPQVLAQLRAGTSEIHYILHTQLVEADLIVLNKCDLLTREEVEKESRWLEAHYPQAKVLPISALTGAGLEDLSQALIRQTASMHRPDIGYGGEAFGQAMGRISEYYIQYHATVCCNDFDGNAYLMDLAQTVRREVAAIGQDIPHLKLLAWTAEGDYGKADLLGVHREITVSKTFAAPCTELAVMLNCSALCPSWEIQAILSGAVEALCEPYNLTYLVFKEECFGMR